MESPALRAFQSILHRIDRPPAQPPSFLGLFENIEIRPRFGTRFITLFIFHSIEIAGNGPVADDVHEGLSLIILLDGSPGMKPAKCPTDFVTSDGMWQSSGKTHHNLLIKACAQCAVVLLQPRPGNSFNQFCYRLPLVHHEAIAMLRNWAPQDVRLKNCRKRCILGR